MSIEPVSPHFAVAPQLTEEEIATAALDGTKVIVCNRPDNEDYDQPPAAQVEAWCRALGMEFALIPVGGVGISEDAIAATMEIIASDKTAIAYCRSGLRSALLWAIAAVRCGEKPENVLEATAKAGHDLGGFRNVLDAQAAPSQ